MKKNYIRLSSFSNFYLFFPFRSILTGLFPTSSGTIFVYDKDIRTDQEVIRKNMGVCMQHNVLFNYLTTKEHLLLYGYIKVPHWSEQELYQEVKRYKNSKGWRRESGPLKLLCGSAISTAKLKRMALRSVADPA